MRLTELLDRKAILNLKIRELAQILAGEQSNELANALFELIQEKQKILLNIKRANEVGKINIGESEIDLGTAVIIRDTMREKIDIITSIINSDSCKLDKLELQKQRDALYSDYILVAMEISRSDLEVTLDYK